MKNALIITLLIFASIIIFSCKKDKPDPNDIVLNYDGIALKAISEKTAIDMANGYRKQHLPLINKNLQLDDTRSIWYDLESFKNLIWEMEMAAKLIYKDGEKPIMGLRVYYGTFPENLKEYKDLEGLPEDYARTHGLMFVPTFEEKGDNKNFNPIKNRKTFLEDSNIINFFPSELVFNVPAVMGLNTDTIGNSNLRLGNGDTASAKAFAQPQSYDYYILDHGIRCPDACGSAE